LKVEAFVVEEEDLNLEMVKTNMRGSTWCRVVKGGTWKREGKSAIKKGKEIGCWDS